MNKMDLSGISTSDLVEELSKRDNATMFGCPLSEVLDMVQERAADIQKDRYDELMGILKTDL